MEQSTRPVDEHETEEYKSLLPSLSEMKLTRDSYKASNRLSWLSTRGLVRPGL